MFNNMSKYKAKRKDNGEYIKGIYRKVNNLHQIGRIISLNGKKEFFWWDVYKNSISKSELL